MRMSYETVEVDLDHGRISPLAAEPLPDRARALLTILKPLTDASPDTARTLGTALRELGIVGRGDFTDLSTNQRHLDDFGG